MNKASGIVFSVILLFCFGNSLSIAQSVLQTSVNLDVQNTEVGEILNDFENDFGIFFSYPSNLISTEKRVSIRVKNEPLEIVLLQILGPNVKLIERGSYIIIQPQQRPKQKKQQIHIMGNLVDATTGERISNATVYEVNSLKSANSNENGSYNLKMKEKSEYVEIAITKENYQDTLLRIHRYDTVPVKLALRPLNEIQSTQKQSTADTLKVVQLLVNKEALFNMDNVSLYEKRRFQCSFLPILGTNKLLSGKTANNISLNIIAGYSYALKGMEVGGFANIIRQNMDGLQIAGFTNIVGGESNGIQISGAFNINKLSLNGAQIAGMVNSTTGEMKGLQIGGFFNFGTQVYGTQICGFGNIAWSNSNALQIGGFLNVAKSLNGSQIAGFVNLTAKDISGTQIAGFANYAGSVKGVQISALSNMTLHTCEGLQIAALLNFAGKLKGIQLGLVNICDTVESGVNIGLLSFVRKGIHEIQLYYSESIPLNIQFKTGTNQFYNIISAGFRTDSLWSFGYGFGTRRVHRKWLYTGMELQFNSMHQNLQKRESINILSQLHPLVGFSRKIGAITLGPVFNLYYVKGLKSNKDISDFDLLPSYFYSNSSVNSLMQMSIGYRMALVF